MIVTRKPPVAAPFRVLSSGPGLVRGTLKDATTVVALFSAAAATPAGDWPQLLGPNRDGVAVGEEPLTELPAEPDVLWSVPVGQGYAGPAVVAGRVFLHHRVDDALRLEACDAATGDQLWAADAPATYRGGMTGDDGPRAVPTVTDPALLGEEAGRVLAVGAAGLLRCVAADDGREFWRRDLGGEFGADLGYFGLGPSPLVIPDPNGGAVVLCVPGGFRQDAGVVGLDLATGETRWTAAKAKPCYGSPILIESDGDAGGVPLAVVPTRVTLYGLNPLTGEIGWEAPFGAQGPTAIGATPVTLPGGEGGTRVFLTSNYNTGDVLLTATAGAADIAYNGEFLLAGHYATPVGFGDGLLYGLGGQERRDAATLLCVEPVAKKTLWERQDGVGYGNLIGVPGAEPGGGSVLHLTLEGDLALFAADPAGYRELGRQRLPGGGWRAVPAYADGVLYARSDDTLTAVRLR